MHLKAPYADPVPRAPVHLVGKLRMFIVDGVVPPDEPIPIGRVAELLRVDLNLALTVLMELGRDGFLERVDGDSVRVRKLSETFVDEIVQIRRLIEPVGVRAAAEHVRPVDVITLRDLVERVETAIQQRDWMEFRRAEDALAATLLALNPNAELARLCTELRLRTHYDGLRGPIEQGVLGQALQYHRPLLDLIEAGDLDGVESLMMGIVDALHFVGAPRMDNPHLVGAPVALDEDADVEFLDATED